MPEYWPANRLVGKLENVLLEAKNILGQIATAQLAEKSVTAEKISVATLSAISVDAGLVTAGTFRGTTFETIEQNMVINNLGLRMDSSYNSEYSPPEAIEWLDKERPETEPFALIYASTVKKSELPGSAEPFRDLVLLSLSELNKSVEIEKHNTVLYLRAAGYGPGGLHIAQAAVSAGTYSTTIVNELGESGFVQTSSLQKLILHYGKITAKWEGQSYTQPQAIEPGGKIFAMWANCEVWAAAAYAVCRRITGSETKLETYASSTSGTPPIGTTCVIEWFALTSN